MRAGKPMRINQNVVKTVLGVAIMLHAQSLFAEERQITFSPKNHCLDNNDNFSPDGRFLCYDTRGSMEPAIGNCRTIEKVEIATGKETVLYQTTAFEQGGKPYPGVGAASYSPVKDKVIFIHGPVKEEVAARGAYAKNNRTGAEVAGDGSGKITWVDKRDIETSRDTIPGAHRGGTHRHEYSRDGKRIGFTYDDFLLPQYDRTIAYMEKNPKAPEGATHYFAILVPVVPRNQAKPGDIIKAAGDSWVDPKGALRAFIGTVHEEDGSFQDSLFTVEIPETLDITTADAGSATRFPSPPKGLKIRRLIHAWANGVVRGSPTGDRIAYYGKASDGSIQIFVIPADGSDTDPDPEKHPIPITSLATNGNTDISGLRWHPSGEYILSCNNGGIFAVTVKPGKEFGKLAFITQQASETKRIDPVISPDGQILAYTRMVDVKGPGKRFSQIFMADFMTRP